MDELAQWLADFVQRRDERAFGLIVQRHIGLVYSSARRQLGDVHLAEEATQAVFVVLAQKAWKIKSAGVLTGWLISTTRFVCQDLLKRQRRRAFHEQKAAAMRPEARQDDLQNQWEEISPVLDEALSRLKEPERSAVAMRYLENREITEVAAALGISRDAAAKRIERAVDKLRQRLAGKNIVLSASTLAMTMAKHGMEVVPPALQKSAVASGLAAVKAGTVGPPSMMKARRLLLAGAVPASLLIIATIWIAMQVGMVGPRASTPVTTIAPTNKLKVGFLVDITGGVGANDSALMFAKQFIGKDEIEAFGLFGHGPDAAAPEVRDAFGAGHALTASNVNDLHKVDVIVAYVTWNVPDDVTDAVNKAVIDGVGFFQQRSFGLIHEPDTVGSYDDSVSGLNAISDGGYFLVHRKVKCQIIGNHPLLAGLRKGPIMINELNGVIGKFNGMPLIAAPDTPSEYLFSLPDSGSLNDPEAIVFYPFYVGQLGKGKIVGVQWARPMDIPVELDKATKGKFYQRCFRWLANRPLE